MVRFAIFCFLVLAAPAAFAAEDAAEDAANGAEAGGDGAPNGRVLLVLDASGSMWGQIDGVNKIVIARETVGDLLDSWQAGTALGLMAYGHRRKGDCGDIEVLVPPGKGTLGAVRDAADDLNPRGKTPLSDAVRRAAKELRSSEEKATVILVTDGKETCEADPCAVARELESAGVDFTAHVIGFDVPEEDRASLQCMAQETGGRYLDARNADELTSALRQTAAESGAVAANLVVTAKAQEYEGWPVMKIFVDGRLLGTIRVEAEDWRDYEFAVADAAGITEIVIDYNNDLYGGTREEDRNLFIKQVRIGERTLAPTEAVYDRYDEPDMQGQEIVAWAGRLIFDLSESKTE